MAKKPKPEPTWDGETRYLIQELRELTAAQVQTLAAGQVPEEIRIVCQQCLDYWPEFLNEKKEIA
jgi:hypothetical protein